MQVTIGGKTFSAGEVPLATVFAQIHCFSVPTESWAADPIP